MTDEIVARVIATIEKAQRLPPGSVTLDSSFEELNIDSLDAVCIVYAIEQDLDIMIPNEAQRVRTVRDAIEFVEAAMS